MKTKLLFLAAMATFALTSCVNDEFIGDPAASELGASDGSINFGFKFPNVTRADIGGGAAATLLGNNFYVMGTKGTEPSNSPTTTVVFDNYLVHYGVNTAGTTESNTANWEYVGVTPGEAPYADYVKLGTYGSQSIKYWDYSQPQYDFLAFSTGTFKAVSGTSGAANEIGVTKIATGTTLASAAYTFDVPSTDALAQTYITDITEVLTADYSKEVILQFKNLGAKVRIALYETVPGYAVKDVNFYQWDGTTDFTTGVGKVKGTTAALISADTYGFPQDASIVVKFPQIGTGNHGKQTYDQASVAVTPVTGNSQKWQTFGTLANFAASKESASLADGSYIGRTLPTATFAGSADAKYYQPVFPVSTGSAITLRVDYTLVSIDGSAEEIKVYGAKAVVPSTYTKWLPNYAYTYIFKISDNTNGWTDPTGATPAGLFPITFDAVVAEATDANAEQATITTVAAPTITTYQQNHNPNKDGEWITTDEYSKAGQKLYVQVMDNSAVPATLVDDLDEQTDDAPPTDRSLLYLISSAATEAQVMDALQNRTTALTAANVTGRNGITLTKAAYITNDVTSIEKGVDNISITVDKGTAAEIAISSLTADQSYAYVYDYSDDAKTVTTIYQPISVTVGTTVVDGKQYIANANIAAWDNGTASRYTDSENAAAGYLYFSITTNGGDSKTYSFISVDDKIGESLPDGLLKLPVSELDEVSGTGVTAAAATSYFDTYLRNTGKYAVKVIKIVD